MSNNNVSVGLGTQVGYGSGLTAFILALIAYFTGHGDEQTLGVIAGSVVSLVMLGVTTAFRMIQAAAKERANIDVAKLGVTVSESQVQEAVAKAVEKGLHDLDDRIHRSTDGDATAVTPPIVTSPAIERQDPDDAGRTAVAHSGPPTIQG